MSTFNQCIEHLELRTLLAASPVGHWTFDEGTGSTAIDSSGSGRNATLSNGVTWVAGNIGANAIRMTGTSTGVATVTGPVVNTAGDFSVSAWVNLSSLSGFQTFVSIAGNTVAGFFLQLRSDGKFAFARLNSDANGNATIAASQSAPVTGRWYHLVGVNNATAGTISLYVDGQLASSSNYTSGWAANGNTFIGHGFYNGQHVDYVNGSIDDVAMYSAALNGAEVVGLDKPAAYSMDDATGVIATDITSNGNNLNLSGGASWTTGRAQTSALDLNGSSIGNAIYGSPVVNTASSFSVSAWVKLDQVNTTQTFVSIDGSVISGFNLQLKSNGKFAFSRTAADSTIGQIYAAESTFSPVAGQWYHLLGISDTLGGQIRLYVNGNLQSTTATPAGWTATGATVIGGGKFAGSRTDNLDGKIDDVQFYNMALSSQAAYYAAFPLTYSSQSAINIPVQETGITISPDLFGIFMEDINYSGEGGMFNDLIRNPGLNDSSNMLRGWSALNAAGVSAALTSDTTTGPTTALPVSGKLAITSGVSASARAAIANTGYFGVAVKPSTTYNVEFYAKSSAGFSGPINVSLESTSGTIHATASVTSISTSWTKYSVSMSTGAGVPLSSANRFVLSTNQNSANGATIWFGSVHCFPPSYQNASVHLRPDLMEKLAAMKPAFYRVPGGNYLEGNDYANRFLWYNTIGPLENRPGHMNPWGYWSSDGMGLDEYLQMAELIGARPLLGLFAGYTLNGTSSSGTQLNTDVQDALNELHYVLDPVTTSWGAMRAANGHPAPYDVREVEIGNEDWFSSTYPTRYPLFYNAIRAEFPQLKIVASHTATGGSAYDIIDEHFYVSAATNQGRQDYYDSRSRSGAKVFVGEWAATEGSPTNNMGAALGDATFLMGLMENSDIVTMEAYAPLFANVNSYQWGTNLIGFDNNTSFGSPSYYAQVMLANKHGTQIVSNTKVGVSGSLRTMVSRSGDQYFLTVINLAASSNTSTINLSGVTNFWPTANVTTMSATSTSAVNTIANPTLIAPSTLAIGNIDNGFSYDFPAYSMTIIEFNAGNSAVGDVPTVAASAAATPVIGTTSNLSSLGADAGGETNLTYTWNTIGTPPAPVTFNINGTNASKNAIATFTASGTYQLQVVISNPAGKSAISYVTVTVNPVATSFVVSPGSSSVEVNSIIPLRASILDQFGSPITSSQPHVTWTLNSGTGTLRNTGVYYAPTATGSASITASTQGYAPITVTLTVVNSLYAYYSANTESGTVLTDSSGNNLNGILSGSYSYSAGKNGNALNLTGGLATLPSGLVSNITGDYTISTWVKPSALQNWARIFDFGTSTSNYMFLTVQNGSNGRPRFAINTGSGEQILDSAATLLSLNTWSHIAVTLNGTLATLYINGVVAGTTSMTSHPADLGNTTQNYLGDSQFSADPMYQGSIDEFRIYPRALSQSEIQTFINTPPAYVVNNRLYVDFGSAPIAIGTSSGNVTISSNGVVQTFDPLSFNDIVVSGTTVADLLTLSNTLPKPMSFLGDTGNDSFTIAVGASYTFASDVSLTTNTMSIVVDGNATFASSQSFTSLSGSGNVTVESGRNKVLKIRSFNLTGKLNLMDNSMAIDYTGGTTPYVNVINKVKQGLTLLGGVGTAGIGSDLVDLQTLPGTMLAVVDNFSIGGEITMLGGIAVPERSILIKYTWFGDANLDGQVTGEDYALTDTGFTSGGTQTGWVFGDMNFDNAVTGDDYALVDTGFIAQSGIL